MAKWLYEMKWPEVKEQLERDDVALFPVGSTEQHGPHLPTGVDAQEAITVAEGVSERTGCVIAPPLWYGWTPHHMAYPGTVTLRPETLTAIAEDVCTSLIYHGFKRVVIINGHRVANLPPLEIAAVKVRNRTGGFIAIYDIALSAVDKIGAATSGVTGNVGHACESETSLMLYRYGHLVDMSKAVRAVHTPDPKYAWSFGNPDPTGVGLNLVSVRSTIAEFGERSGPTGVGGDATLASVEKGQRIYEGIVENLCELVERWRTAPVTLRTFDPPL
ncbi:MAG: creatininase family protein [Chloroflexi bacterium]|nr:creatininase family protein [Chloroflexota bacterium]